MSQTLWVWLYIVLFFFSSCTLISRVVFILGQVLKDTPSSVLSEVVMCLNNPSPLRNNWKAVAAELSLNFQTVQSLDHHCRGGMMDGVLDIMFQRKTTVQNLADMLEKIQRPDIIEILIKAGLPKSNVQCGNTNGMLQFSWIHTYFFQFKGENRLANKRTFRCTLVVVVVVVKLYLYTLFVFLVCTYIRDIRAVINWVVKVICPFWFCFTTFDNEIFQIKWKFSSSFLLSSICN